MAPTDITFLARLSYRGGRPDATGRRRLAAIAALPPARGRVRRNPSMTRLALADELQDDLAVVCSVAMLDHEHPLPGAQRQRSVTHRHVE